MIDIANTVDSSLREKVIEHAFVGEILKCLWRKGMRDVEVLHSEVDNAGYDIVLDCSGVLRHVQLKSSYRGAKTSRVNINQSLAEKPSGCVIWIWFDPETIDLGRFLWFGGVPGAALPPLGDRVAKHTKGDRAGVKADRPNIRVLNKGRFTVLDDIDSVAETLFAVSG